MKFRRVIPSLVLILFASTANAATYHVKAGSVPGNGTVAKPFGTIQEAANKAAAGDTVIIADGKYPENLIVKHSGTPAHPIVFRAEHLRGARAYSIRPEIDAHAHWSSDYVTVQGIDFDAPADNPPDTIVYAGTGWDFEDCTIQHNNSMAFDGDREVHLGYITIRHCIFQDCSAVLNGTTSSFGGYSAHPADGDYLHDVRFINSIVRRSNFNNKNTGWDSGTFKFFISKNVVLDGLISYDNNGEGMWFDTDNQSFVIKNCTVFGNHSGFFFNSGNKFLPADNKIWDNTTSAGGIDNEANQGPALIENNAIYSNQTGRGIIANSSGNGHGVAGDHSITIRNNLFADNYIHLWIEGIEGPEPTRGLGAHAIYGNTFYAWNLLDMESGATPDLPSAYQIKFSKNIYDTTGKAGISWAYWDKEGVTKTTKSLSEMQMVYGIDQGSMGKALGHFRGQLPPGSIFPSPTKAQVEADHNARAVSEVVTPKSSIDRELSAVPSGRPIHKRATITVFGRTPFVSDLQSGSSACEVYDFQGRWLKLVVPTKMKSQFEALVTLYAITTGTKIEVYVTWKSSYLVKAIYAGIPSRN